MRHQKILLPAALVVAVMAAVMSFSYSRARVAASSAPEKPEVAAVSTTAQSPPPAAQAAGGEYVRRGRLRPALRAALAALGDRLERPGKERVTTTGAISRAGGGDPVPFALELEFSGRLLIELRGRRVVDFDERPGVGARPDLSEEDAALVETLAYDTAERFFSLQARGAATRFIGSRFRLDDGSDASYPGPYYDIYQVNESVRAGAGERSQAKLFYLNSDTLLVERVRYGVVREGRQVNVEVTLGDWRQVAGQQVPGRVVRTEDGEVVLTVTLDSIALGPREHGNNSAPGELQ